MALQQNPKVIEKHRHERDEVRVLHGATGNSVHYESPQELDSDAISKIIKQGTGLDEDAYQDAWLRVVEENISDPINILQVAKECRNHNTNQSIAEQYRAISLEAPAYKDTKDSEPLPLVETISSPIVNSGTEGQSSGYVSKLDKARLRRFARNITVDTESLTELKKRYPSVPMWKAIRMLLGLPTREGPEPHEAFQPWEDEIIQRLYPIGGPFLVKTELDRGRDAIIHRAGSLGIVHGPLHLDNSWIVQKDVARILGVTQSQVGRWRLNKELPFFDIKQRIQHIKYKVGWDIYFIEKADLVAFMQKYPMRYRRDAVREDFQHCLPAVEYWTLKEAATKTNVPGYIIRGWCRSGLTKTVKGRWSLDYISSRDAQKIQTAYGINPDMGHVFRHDINAALPHKVLRVGQTAPYHFALSVAEKPLEKQYRGLLSTKVQYDIALACKSRSNEALNWKGGPYFFVEYRKGLPTCKVCLGIYHKWQRNKLIGLKKGVTSCTTS